jgi:hypothetical protein
MPEMTRRKQAISIQSLVNTWTVSRAAAYFVLGWKQPCWWGQGRQLALFLLLQVNSLKVQPCACWGYPGANQQAGVSSDVH